EPERVLLALEPRARGGGDALQQLLGVLVGLRELACRERLEDGGPDAGRLEAARDVERDGGGREGEEPVARRPLQLLATEENVGQAHRCSFRRVIAGEKRACIA